MGKTINHMRLDTYEIAQRLWEFQSLITQPVSIVLSTLLIWWLIRWPCLIGVLTVLVGQGLNTPCRQIIDTMGNPSQSCD